MTYQISVAIPAYNRADYLKETLDSILSQTYPASEIIVVDDGSTDNTPDVIASYGSQIKSLRIDNSGAAIARKTAVEATSSPWLAFCDSDDLWLPHHLERRVNQLKKYPQVNFSFSDLSPFGPTAKTDHTYFADAAANWWQQFPDPDQDNCVFMGQQAYIPFLSFNPGSPVTTVMTRELYDKIGGIDPRYSRMVAEDADMARKAVLHGIVLCDKTVTAKQRRHSGNMSAQVLQNLLGKCQILENHISFNIAPKTMHPAIQLAIGETLQEAFLAAYYVQNKHQAKSIINKLGWSNLSIKDRLRFLYLKIQLLGQ
ncbi:MAG: glycosyltransferase [Methylomarinum sp.]|nr:glycosyltransferase [Methylomarinum sp.]